jgi:hypothetical protein
MADPVFQFEYTINQVRMVPLSETCLYAHGAQGIAPTLVYPVPSPSQYWLLSKIIKSIRDYYPLWQVRTLPSLISMTADDHICSYSVGLSDNGLCVAFVNLPRYPAAAYEAVTAAGICPGFHTHPSRC